MEVMAVNDQYWVQVGELAYSAVAAIHWPWFAFGLGLIILAKIILWLRRTQSENKGKPYTGQGARPHKS